MRVVASIAAATLSRMRVIETQDILQHPAIAASSLWRCLVSSRCCLRAFSSASSDDSRMLLSTFCTFASPGVGICAIAFTAVDRPGTRGGVSAQSA